MNSIFGRKGAVTAQSGDYTTSLVTEGSNLYFTNGRVDAEIRRQARSRAAPGTYGKIFVSNGTAWTAVSTSTLGISALDLTGVLPVSKGGLNLSSAPAYGQIPVGTVSGGYSLTATSSLGLPTFEGRTRGRERTLSRRPRQSPGQWWPGLQHQGIRRKVRRTTDDTLPLNSAIAAASSTTGGTIFVPTGVCRI